MALTKVALVDADTRELVALDIQDRIAGTFLEGAEVVPVDVLAGDGVEALAAALDRLVGATPPAVDRNRPRLWVDRSFAIRGAGTVVTGTLAGGSIALNDDLFVAPAGRPVRVRRLESHYGALTHAGPGRRLAVNLSGADRHHVARGHALVRPGQWHVTTMLRRLPAGTGLRRPAGRRPRRLRRLPRLGRLSRPAASRRFAGTDPPWRAGFRSPVAGSRRRR